MPEADDGSIIRLPIPGGEDSPDQILPIEVKQEEGRRGPVEQILENLSIISRSSWLPGDRVLLEYKVVLGVDGELSLGLVAGAFQSRYHVRIGENRIVQPDWSRYVIPSEESILEKELKLG